MKWELINTTRKSWVDALRGLAILLVVYGHCIKWMPLYWIFTNPFKMPLFFAITGYVFNMGSIVSWGKFLKQLFRKVFVPWMFLGLSPAVIMLPFKGFGYIINVFLGMLAGRTLWFMPCFFIGEIIWYINTRYCKKTLGITILAFVCFGLGNILFRNGLMNYAMFNRALSVQPFFLIGYLFRQYENRIITIRWRWILVAIIVYIGLCLLNMVLFPGKWVGIHANRYYNLPYCILLIYLSCFIFFTAASKADFRSNIMSFIGQNTLVIYILHGIFIALLVKGLFMMGYVLPINEWTAIVMSIFACLTCGIIAIILNRFLPEAVGKKRLEK